MAKRKHTTTKNTVTKNPVTKLAEYTLDVNGIFTIVTDLTSSDRFDKIYKEWFHSPETFRWCGESLVDYIKGKIPSSICLLKKDYEEVIKGKGIIPATKEEWESENN